MSKVYNYMVLAVGLTFLLKFAGIPSGADALLSWVGLSGDVSGVSLGVFFTAVVILFTVGTGIGIAISFITRSPSETFLVASIALGVFTVITATFVSVINFTKDMGYIYYITWLVFAPLIVSFAIAIIQFWRGSDI